MEGVVELEPREAVDRLAKEAKEHPVEAFEVYCSSSEGTSVEVRKGEVDSFETARSVGLSVRLFKEKKLGFSYCSGTNVEDMCRVMGEALEGLNTCDTDPGYGLPELAVSALPILPIYDERISRLSKEERIQQAVEMEDAAFSFDKRIRKVRKSSYHDSVFETFLLNSRGVERSFKGSLVSLSIAVVAEENDSHMGWDFDFSRWFDSLGACEVGERAAKKAVELLGARSISSRTCPIILDSYVASQFASALSSSFLADSVQKNRSLLIGKRDKKVFSPLVEVWDDGTLRGGMATSPCDGEGVPRQRTGLVREGVVLGYLYDTYCAKKEGTSSTGNTSRRDVKGLPTVGLSNFYVKEGSSSPEELISGAGRGILVTEVMGMHTVNPVSGDFSVGVGGLWIEGGEIQFPVRGLAVAGNLLTLFQRVDAVGNDLRFYGSVGAPSILFGPTSVSGS
jgi:PmbA protein